MEKRRLGRTEIQITPIGLGCWQFGQGGAIFARFWSPLDQNVITDTVAAALKSGINWFDTAEIYGSGSSEQALATALSSLKSPPGEAVIATKWFPLFRSARSIRSTIKARLECLSPYPIDLHQVHQPFSHSPISAQMAEMASLLKEGLIKSIGVSNFSARQMEEAHSALAKLGIPLASNQIRYNLLDRRIEANGILDSAKRLGVTLIAYSPLAQGLLSGRFHDDPSQTRTLPRVRRLSFSPAGRSYRPENLARTRPLIDELRQVATTHDATPSQIALAWLITHYGDTVVAIPGATRFEQAADNAAAMRIELAHDELARLGEASERVARG